MTYVDGWVAPVPKANRERYREEARRVAELFKRCGALGVTECWGDDVPKGKLTDFYMAVTRRWCSPGSCGRTRPRAMPAWPEPCKTR
jgi:uncharacterized protein YbaA (DUF1428 family)